MFEWRDIASAPKDGTAILVSYRHMGQWVFRLVSGDVRYDPTSGDTFVRWLALPGGAQVKPTFWQPLPLPPDQMEE